MKTGKYQEALARSLSRIERLEREKRQAEERLRMLARARRVMSECSRVLVRAHDEGQLLQDMCRIAADTSGYRLAWIGLTEHDADKTIRPVASAGEHADHLATTRISWGDDVAGQGPAGTAVRTRSAQVARHIRSDPYFCTARQQVVECGFESVAALPLVSDDEVMGVLGILAAEPDAFDADELALLEELARHIAYGVANLRVLASQRRNDRLLRLEHTVTSCLATADGAAMALKAAMRAVCETQGWECGRYFRADDAAGVVRFEEAWGVASPGIERFIERSRTVTYGPGVGVIGHAWQSGEPLWIADLDRDPRAQRAAYTVESRIRAALLIPVLAEGRTIGVLAFSSREIREPDERLLEAMRVIGSQIGQFLHRVRREHELKRFRAAMDLSIDSIVLTDRATMRFIDVNRTACAQTGYTREELLQMGPHDLGSMTREQHERHYDELISGARAPEIFASVRRLRDGRVNPVEIHRSVVPADGGHIIVAVVRDISERVRAERLQKLEHAITRCLAASDGVAATLSAVLRVLCEAEGWECGRYFRVDEAAGVLRYAGSWHVADPLVRRFVEDSRDIVFPRGCGLTGLAWESGQALWSTDIGADPRALPAARAADLSMHMRGGFVVPVSAEGKVIGMLNFSSRLARQPDERLLEAMRVIGSQIGQFVQRKRNEDDLRRFRAALDASPDLVMLVEPVSMRYVDVNDAACRALGYSRQELLAMGPNDVFSAPREELERTYRSVIAGERQAPVEGWYRCRDGSQLLVEAFRRAVPSAEGDIITVVARDITERRGREDELQRFRAAMDTSSDMIMLVDRTTMLYVDVNTTACEMQGYTREEMLRIGPQDVSGIPRAELEQAYDRMIAGGQITWQRSTHRQKDGTTVPIEVYRRAVRTDRGWIIVAIVRDISERARTEQLQNLEHAVANLLAAADSAPEALTAVMRAICETEDWGCGRYFGVEEKAGVLRLDCAWTADDPAMERFAEVSRTLVFRRGEGLAGRSWDSGEALWSADIGTDSRVKLAGLAQGLGIRTSVMFPVTSEGRVLGVISLSTRRGRQPDERLLRTVGAIGSQLGQFLRRKQAEAVVRESEARFRSLTRLSSDWYWEQDEEYRFVDMTNEIDRKTGVSALAHIGKRRWELAAPNMTDADWTAHRAVVEAHQPFQELELCRIAEDGNQRWVSISGEPIFDTDGTFRGYRGVGKDITERKREEQLLNLEHTVTRRLAEADGATAGLQAVIRAICETEGWDCGRYLRWDEQTGVLRFSASWSRPDPAIERFLEAKRDSVLRPGEGLAGAAWQKGEPIWVADVNADSRSTGTAIAFETGMRRALHFPVISEGIRIGLLAFNARAIREPDQRLLQAIQVIGSQIGRFLQHKEGEERLAHLAEFDTVTGLPNRHLFRDRLGQSLTHAARNGWLGAMLFIDLDRFKAVNDTYGHAMGDRLLKQVAARLKDCVRGGDTVARLSGDEFAVVLSNLAKADDAGLVAQKIVGILAAPFDLEGPQAYVSASVGISLFPADGADADVLIKNADTAMYRAKEQGRNGYQFYLPEMNERLLERRKLETRLRGALDRGEFRLHYQPKARLEGGGISGFEALLRWQQDDRLVPPLEFIPILEETGLIVPVGEWVLRTVCCQLRQWEDRGIVPQPVSVNLSARQFQDRCLAKTVRQILRETGVSPDLLELELTETLLMSDAEESVQMLHELKALGVRLAIDDFGTGYSSLAYLKRFPLDTLKIDRAFIRDVAGNPDDAMLTRTIINLAQSMRLRVVAEGVETGEQLSFLKLHGCDEIQGYYFARPLDAKDCTQALIEGRTLQDREGEKASAPEGRKLRIA